MADPDPLLSEAYALDAADPLAAYRDHFLVPDETDVLAYFDGNSLGRPLRLTADRIESFVRHEWAGRLIRGWTDGWLEWPERIGDLLGRAALGAGPGQVVVADSTTVMLYKLASAALAARPGRREVVVDTDNFPTDRYVLEGLAATGDVELRWVETDPETGITADQVAETVGPSTALVLLSHVAYRSAWIADAPEITRLVHDAGGLVLWDLSHSVGSVEVALDDWGVDAAVGCTYKYLNGGPGAPAFGYLRRDLQADLRQPIWGWMGRADAFEMGAGWRPAEGPRHLLSGTPPILGMVPLLATLELLHEVGMPAVRAKSVQLTEYALELTDAWLTAYAVEVASPRDSSRRGGHVTLRRPGFAGLLDTLWRRGVVPDYRRPDGLRIGLSPLSTSFAEVYAGLAVLRDVLAEEAA